MGERAVKVSEAVWQRTVTDMLTSFGWRWYHSWRSDHSAAGWPDIVAVRRERLIALELKSERGRTTAPQDAWLDALEQTGVEVHVAYPSGVRALEELLR